MAESAEFRPEELDRIEDALEGLEFDDAIDDGSPLVAARLQEYRSILALSRDALAFEDVPPGVLEAVMAEAQAGRETMTVEAAAPQLDERPSRWHRFMRMMLVPGLALAGTAALVLVMVRTTFESPPAPAPSVAQTDAASNAAPKDQPAAGDAAAVPAAPLAAPPATAVAEEKAESADVEQAFESTLAREAPAAEPAKLDDLKKGEAAPTGGSLAPADEEQTVWSTLALGDRARTSGDCDTARVHYRRALEDADTQARARAHAGIGFCDAWAGEHVSATEHYDEAKKLNPGIAEFIEANRPQGTGGGAKASKSSRKKSKATSTPKQAAPANQNAFDELSKE